MVKFKKVISFAIAMCLTQVLTLQAMAAPANSENVKFEERTKFGSVEVTDKIVGDIRTIETVSENGNIRLFEENLKAETAKVYVNGKLVETYNMKQEREKLIKQEMPEEDIIAIQKLIENSVKDKNFKLPNKYKEYNINKKQDGSIFVDLGPIVSAASGTPVYPAGHINNTYPVYYDSVVNSTIRWSSVLGRDLYMRVEDSMYSFVESSRYIQPFTGGAAIDYVMAVVKISANNALNYFSGLWSFISGTYKLSQNCDYYKNQEYRFNGLRQGCVYDYTGKYYYVSARSEYGTGKIALTWDWNGYEYYNARWAHISQAYPFLVSYSTMYDNAQSTWEYNILEYGYWPYGDI